MSAGNAFLVAMERLIEDLHDVAGAVADRGHGMARTYVAAAITSLRLATSMMIAEGTTDELRDAPYRLGQARRLRFVDGLPTDVFVLEERGVSTRGRMGDAGFLRDPDADFTVPAVRTADLGADLLGSALARDFVVKPLAAALLAEARGSRGWKHPASSHSWSCSRTAARSIISTLTGGIAVRSLRDDFGASVLDRRALAIVESLGWRRHVGDRDLGRR